MITYSSTTPRRFAFELIARRRPDEELAAFIGDTAMTRAGVKALRKNLAVALGNSGDRRALEALSESVAIE